MQISVLIAVPTRGRATHRFWAPLADLAAYMARHLPHYGIEIEPAESSLVLQARQGLAHKALAMAVTHIFWLDDDMIFPPDALARLLRHGGPVIGANYTTRTQPIRPTAAKDGALVYSKGKSGIEEVDHVALGCCLTDIAIFQKVPEPWFALGWHPKTKDFIGEDVFFCRQARQHGFKIFVDHDLSQRVYHEGIFEWGHDTTEPDLNVA